jgi:3D (Asp-Asp-Asp) domain-containing protein
MKSFDSIFDIEFNDVDTNIDIDTKNIDVYLDTEDDFFTRTNSSVDI